MEEKVYPVEPDVLRFELCRRQPYLRAAVYRLRPVRQDGIGTFATDATWHWYFDKEVPFTPEEQVTVLFHEVNHLLRNHHARCGVRKPTDWNVAADAEINDDFPSTMPVPPNLVRARLFDLPDGELAEWYYDRVKQWEIHVREDATGCSAGSGKCATNPKCNGEDKAKKVDAKQGYKVTVGIFHAPACGGGAGGEDDEDYKPPEDDRGVGEVEQEAIRRDVAQKIEQQSAFGRGNIPGNLERWAKELLHPEVPWERLLRTHTRRASIIISGMTEQTYSRPSRREYGDFIMPKRIARKTSAAFYVDTSGSVDDEMLQVAMTEVRAALRSNAAEMFVAFLDTDVKSCTKVSTLGHFRLLVPKGRGGTDMRVAFEHYKTLKPKVNLVVVLTDGHTPWPDAPPHGVQTIVVLTKPKNAYQDYGKSPVWAKTIKIGGTR